MRALVHWMTEETQEALVKPTVQVEGVGAIISPLSREHVWCAAEVLKGPVEQNTWVYTVGALVGETTAAAERVRRVNG